MEFSGSLLADHVSTGMYLTSLSGQRGLVHQTLKTEPPLSFISSHILILVDGAGNTPAALILAFYWLIQTSKIPDKPEVPPSQTKSLPPHCCAVIPWDAHHK